MADVAQPLFLEASAGTGKTYAIEHHFVRLLLELPTTVERILVVTFTKAAARQLRERIRSRLVQFVDRPLIQDALNTFDEALITTIHGFCGAMLGEFSMMGGDMLTLERQRNVVRDCLRVKGLELLCRSQLSLIGPSDELVDKVLGAVGKTRQEGLCLVEGLSQFQAAMRALKGYDLITEFEQWAPQQKGLCDRQGAIKPDAIASVGWLAGCLKQEEWRSVDFDQGVGDGLEWLTAEGKVRGKEVAAPGIEAARAFLGPLMAKARSPQGCLSVLAREATLWLERVMEEEGLLSYDGLLKQMAKAIEQPAFRAAVRGRFDAVIIDEFQDTDPVQWSIFKSLFADGTFPLIVVGDPKQSIYAFRNADIYTYLEAREVMPHRATLDVNYRSLPDLVEALNGLFGAVPGLLPLPRLGTELIYQPVSAGVMAVEAMQAGLWIGRVTQRSSRAGSKFPSEEMERTVLFPWIAEAMIGLRNRHNLDWSAFAVLVADRYQAARLQGFLKGLNIPAVSTRGRPFGESVIPRAFRELLEAIHSDDRSLWRAAAVGPVLGCSPQELLDQTINWVERFEALREVLSQGAPALVEFLEGCGWARPMALEEIRGVAAWLGDQPIQALREIEGQCDDEAPRLWPTVDGQAVTLQTIFGSKGLEYQVVFALACASRMPEGVNPAETVAEMGRLFYVALTRAKTRVYLPWVVEDGASSSTSMSELFLRQVNPESLPNIFVDDIEPCIVTPQVALLSEEASCVRPSFAFQPEWVQSYTKLARRLAGTEEVQDDLIVPAGAETGILLHTLLERVSFQASVAEIEEMADFIPSAWRHEAAEMAHWALNVPLNGFSLADVDPKSVLREAEFVYGLDRGLMTGFADVVIRHEGRYYLIDYKSNALERYDSDHLAEVMKREDYFLQASIYREALRRYVALFEERPFEEVYGGMYYLFLRGGVYRCL